ncbi:hypothetical protein FB561_3109 [Kribbella amoyensis]|uniref:Neutral zinc metallopeptidase n=1 Tax=Kribbella amoyensis TaxID=996641 RepID=A0A561BSY3_9ACTN|nr:neutral zinc metallopeptidase [Kribbella amoyensis]TWD81985.1 hypothetical protein FB561_3109 [Kribbella amoyensis]
MKHLSSKKLRGLVGAIALASCAALAMPNAQAVTAGPTAVQPLPVVGEVAEVPPNDSGRDAGWTSASAWNAVRYNKLYNTGAIPASKCKRPNVALNTEYRVRYFEQELVRCMHAVWKSNLWRAGNAKWNVKPNLVVHGYNTIKTSCGSVTGWISFYCSSGNGTIYIPWRQIVTYYSQNPTFAVAYATNTIAHEYGHHVQAMSGLLTASWWRQNHMSKDAGLAESRRRELQASCFGSAYIGANKAYYPMTGGLKAQWDYVVSHSGDRPGYPRDHGSWTSHNFWSQAGFKGNGRYSHPGSCQTWAAPATRIA